MNSHDYDQVHNVKNYLFEQTKYRPTIGVICGSGLGGLADALIEKEEFAYEKIPQFPAVTVKGHAGKLVFGKLQGKIAVCLQGRFHFYEGHSIHRITFPVRVLCALGIKTMIVTNAAGGINKEFNIGDIMVMRDHIGFPVLAGSNPLVGPNDERFGPRFTPMSQAYDRSLAKMALAEASALGFSDFTRHGVYAMVSGPSYETIAEVRALQVIGADAVGMSTVPETIVAAHCGVRVLGISLITNKCVDNYETDEQPNHAEVLEVGKKRAKDVQKVVEAVIGKLE